MRSKFTFLNKVFAYKLVWYLATRFNPDPMGFLIEVNIPEGSKIGTMLSKTKNVRKLWHQCCSFDEIHSTSFANCVLNIWLFQRSGHLKVIWLSWFEQKLGLVCQTTCFFCFFFHGFWVFLRLILTKNRVISSKLPTGDTWISQCWVSYTILCKKVAQKLYRKMAQTFFKKTWKFWVFFQF